MIRILCFSIAFLFASLAIGQPTFYRTKVKDGDGVYSLLRRHQLNRHACNVNEFYKINKLSREEALNKDKAYLLPVLVYNYNGKSIRSTIGIDDWDLASRIAQYNKDLLTAKIIKKRYQNSKILLVPFHILKCDVPNVNTEAIADNTTSKGVKAVQKEKITKKETVSVPLFGDAMKTVEVKDKSLKGQVFYVLAGHGGPDPGTVGKRSGHTLCEDEYAYDVTLRLAKNLIERGATVEIVIQDKNDGIRSGEYLDCDKDERCVGNLRIPLDQGDRLRQRTDAINKLYKKYKRQGVKTQKLCVLHIDSTGIRFIEKKVIMTAILNQEAYM
jgi:N-acetylmuramoyl-L-alanine amidase